jgi:hypothetical protein
MQFVFHEVFLRLVRDIANIHVLNHRLLRFFVVDCVEVIDLLGDETWVAFAFRGERGDALSGMLSMVTRFGLLPAFSIASCNNAGNSRLYPLDNSTATFVIHSNEQRNPSVSLGEFGLGKG